MNYQEWLQQPGVAGEVQTNNELQYNMFQTQAQTQIRTAQINAATIIISITIIAATILIALSKYLKFKKESKEV